MKKLIVSSLNKAKIHAVKEAFSVCYSSDTAFIKGYEIDSGVGNQPLTEKDTIKGAVNRASLVKELYPDNSYWIGIEGGLSRMDNKFLAFAWVVVIDRHSISKARTASYFLPDPIDDLISQGYELGQACNIYYKKENVKVSEGSIGCITNNLIIRKDLYKPALILAFKTL